MLKMIPAIWGDYFATVTAGMDAGVDFGTMTQGAFETPELFDAIVMHRVSYIQELLKASPSPA